MQTSAPAARSIKTHANCQSRVLYEDEKQRLMVYEVEGHATSTFELQTPIGNGAYHTENQLEVTKGDGPAASFTPMLLGLIVQQASINR